MRKLTPRELEEEMILVKEVKTPIGQLLADPGEKVTYQLINRMKLYKVEYVYVEGEDPDEEAENAPAEAPIPAQKAMPEPSKQVMEAKKFHGFELQYYQTVEQMKVVFNDIINQKTEVDTTKLLDMVAELFRARGTTTELLEMLYKMHSLTDTVYAHSLNVALISRMIGRWLKLDKAHLDTLTVAGLLHDIGKLLIPEEVLNKEGSLSDEEFALIKSHPRKGYDILKNLNIDPRIKKAALMHHERSDGSGYPSHLEDEFIDEYAMIIAIADVYDAMTAARSYRSPLCPFQVIANFEKEGYQKYHTKYILTFLKQIAATYQNSRVILSDGRGCKIVMLNQHNLSRPIVQFDDNTCLDLSYESKDLYIHKVIS